jgi:hypothetical protein
MLNSPVIRKSCHHLWLALLVCANIAFSFSFACATPFAAFSTAAALTLNRRDAMLLTGAVWPANQFVGFIFSVRYSWSHLAATSTGRPKQAFGQFLQNGCTGFARLISMDTLPFVEEEPS